MLRLFSKPFRRAQTTVEYALIVTLVAAAIIIAGPYVIRSWNAHLKTTESSLVDSTAETFEEADSGQFDLPSCTCDNWSATICQASLEGENCSQFERGYTRNCTGTARICEEQGYDTFRCVADDTCCTDWIDGLCGINAEHITCADGFREQMQECGAPGNWVYRCERDTACDFDCELSISWPPPGSYELCVNSGSDPDDESGLSQNTEYSFVVEDGCTSDKCEIQCVNGYYPDD